MILENSDAVHALALWASLNLALMLILALNVFRWRVKENVVVGLSDSFGLERAMRAHGNNTEYVPSILFGLLLMALLGENPLYIHIGGGVLLLARILHAIGIQQSYTPVPLARASGNIVCWLLFATVIIRLLLLSL